VAALGLLAASWAGRLDAGDFVYSASQGSPTVSGYALDVTTGALTPLPGSPFPADGPTGVALHPTGRYLYVTNRFGGTIATLAVDAATGALTPVGAPTSTGWFRPGHIALHPSGRFVFVCHQDVSGRIAAFAIDPTTGALTSVPGSPFYGLSYAEEAVVDPTGRVLYAVGDDSDGRVRGYSIDPNTGALVSIVADHPSGQGPSGLAVDPTGRFLYVTSGSNFVYAFSINGTGQVTPIEGSPFPEEGGNHRAPTVDASGRFLYVANFDSDTVSGYGIDPGTGALTPVLTPIHAGDGPWYLAIDLSNRFLYASNLISNDVSAFRIDNATGALTALAGSPVPAGTSPGALTTGRNFTRGDFDGDGRSDLLWRRDGPGENVVWYMNGTTLAGGTFLAPLADNRWRMVGTHDFNRDRRSDILWRHDASGENVLWYMNGTAQAGSVFLQPPALADVRWTMAGTGDFNQDGRPDIAWRHETAGQIVVWYMNGAVLAGGTFTNPSVLADTDWRLVGVADFNGDNRPDLLWHHRLAGQVVIWYMNGTVLSGGTFTTPAAEPDLGWSVVAVGDYNDDRRPDIVWRHSVSGEDRVWLMNGAVRTAEVPLTGVPEAAWRLVGPR
jgi:6-phosphogluconolactonase (cycloisomerase 2 family)